MLTRSIGVQPGILTLAFDAKKPPGRKRKLPSGGDTGSETVVSLSDRRTRKRVHGR